MCNSINGRIQFTISFQIEIGSNNEVNDQFSNFTKSSIQSDDEFNSCCQIKVVKIEKWSNVGQVCKAKLELNNLEKVIHEYGNNRNLTYEGSIDAKREREGQTRSRQLRKEK